MGTKENRELFDKFVQSQLDPEDGPSNGQIVAMQLVRNGILAALQPESANFAAMQRLYLPHVIGQPKEELEVKVTASRGMFISETGAALFGAKYVRGKVLNKYGEEEEIEIREEEADGRDD